MSSNANYWSSRKIFAVALLTLAIYAVCTEGYLGPRYGKRLPFPASSGLGKLRRCVLSSCGEVSRIVGRSSAGPRAIQSRSQARFYAGSRYGGKRSFWPSTFPGPDGAEDPLQSPYDCVYLPYVGVRCNMLRVAPGRGLENRDDDEGGDDDGGSPTFTRTSIIESPPASSSGGSE